MLPTDAHDAQLSNGPIGASIRVREVPSVRARVARRARTWLGEGGEGQPFTRIRHETPAALRSPPCIGTSVAAAAAPCAAGSCVLGTQRLAPLAPAVYALRAHHRQLDCPAHGWCLPGVQGSQLDAPVRGCILPAGQLAHRRELRVL